MNITAKQIAEMVKVSKQAVYSVLSNKPKCLVSPEKKEQILFLAKAYHYKQNTAALSLNGKSTFQIGAVIDSFAGKEGGLLSRMALKLAVENYDLKASPIISLAQGMEMIQKYIDCGADAVIYSGWRLSGIHQEEYSVPLLSHGDEFGTDHFTGGRIITEHLIREHGHRNILFVTTETRNAVKYVGYCAAMQEAGLEVLPALPTIMNPQFPDQLKKYLKQGVTAIVTNGDTMAARLIWYLRRHGFRVPEDVAVAGCDSSGAYPEISAVRTSSDKLAALGCQMVLEKIRTKNLGYVR